MSLQTLPDTGRFLRDTVFTPELVLEATLNQARFGYTRGSCREGNVSLHILPHAGHVTLIVTVDGPDASKLDGYYLKLIDDGDSSTAETRFLDGKAVLLLVDPAAMYGLHLEVHNTSDAEYAIYRDHIERLENGRGVDLSRGLDLHLEDALRAVCGGDVSMTQLRPRQIAIAAPA